MKKLLMSTIVLCLFSLSMILFQASCKKDAKAENINTTVNQSGKVIYTKQNGGGYEIWVANYDGSGASKLIVSLPENYRVDNITSISPDHKTIFLTIFNPSTDSPSDLYSIGIDGGEAKKVIEGTTNGIAY